MFAHTRGGPANYLERDDFGCPPPSRHHPYRRSLHTQHKAGVPNAPNPLFSDDVAQITRARDRNPVVLRVTSPWGPPQGFHFRLRLQPSASGLRFRICRNPGRIIRCSKGQNRREFAGAQLAACGSRRCRAYRPQRSCGRVAEGGGLLNRYRVVKPYRGFESLRLRHLSSIGRRYLPKLWARDAPATLFIMNRDVRKRVDVLLGPRRRRGQVAAVIVDRMTVGPGDSVVRQPGKQLGNH